MVPQLWRNVVLDPEGRMSGFVRAFVKYLLNHALAIILILGMIVLIMGMTRALFPVKVVTVRRVTTADTVLKNVPVPTLKLVDRIVYRTVAPETVLVSQYHTDTLIRQYCAAAADTNPKAARLFLNVITPTISSALTTKAIKF